MRKQLIAGLAVTFGMLAATTGFAGPAVAAQDSDVVWEMPDVRGMVLQQAVNAVFDVTGPAELDLRLIDSRAGQQVINQTNWAVCAQSPGAGGTISQKTMRVVLYVKRFNQRYCGS